MTLFGKFSGQQKKVWRDPWEGNLKGRMAESLVYDLLKESGNEIYRLGYESVLPGLTGKKETRVKKSKIGEKLRVIPDFFMIDKSGEPYLIEVKFRWNAKLQAEDVARLARLNHFWEEALLVIVNCSRKPYFRVARAPFAVGSDTPKDERPLEDILPFRISGELLAKFDVLVEKYLKPTLSSPLPKESAVLKHRAQYIKPVKR